MASPEDRRGPERDDSCFSRAARAIRRALSRICRQCCATPAPSRTPSSTRAPSPAPSLTPSSTSIMFIRNRHSGGETRYRACKRETACLHVVSPPMYRYSRGKTRCRTSREEKRLKTESASSSSGSSNEWLPPPAKKTNATAGQEREEPVSHLPKRSEYEGDSGCSQSLIPTFRSSPPARRRLRVSRESLAARDAFESSPKEHERDPGGDTDVLTEADAPVEATSHSVTNAPPEPGHPSPPNRSVPSLSPVTSSSFEEFTPDITADEDGETFRLRCPRPGLYLCSVTGLVFHMGGDGGEVAYRIVPWDQRLLARHHKKAAGPLFDIKCEQRSVLGLQLPHCEILSGGGGDFLSVAHLEDDAEAFLRPKEVTETHVLVDVSGLSAFGNVKDEDFPPQPVRALVLLFYRAPDDPDDPESFLNVLMLPINVVLREVQRIRRNQDRNERYIDTPPQCKLHPDRDYVLSTSPQDDLVTVQPKKADFDCNNYDNYFPSFQVILETRLNHITLLLKECDGSLCVWERRVPLIVRASGGPSAPAPDLANSKRLLEVRTGFVEGISGPALKSLLDRLLEKKVITDAEGEAAEATPNHRDRARFVIDIVRKKGEDASLEMIEFLKEADTFLCEHLGLL